MKQLIGHVFAGFLALAVAFPTPGQEPPRRYALVVGVRAYPVSDSLNPLAYTEPDATEVAASLKKSGYDVMLMTQSAARVEGGERFAPNVAMLRKMYASLATNPFLTNKDCLLIYLAGHGIQLQSKDGTRQAWYFCPADAEIDGLEFIEQVEERHHLLSVEELYETLNKSKAGVKLLVIDACRNDPSQPAAFRAANSVTRPKAPEPPGGAVVLFSCSPREKAMEDPKLKHGVFSYFLIQALNGKADLDGNKQINIAELYQYVGRQVLDYVRAEYSSQQQPEMRGTVTGFAALVSLPEAATPKPKPLAAGEEWAGNSLGMKFAWCPPGAFTMGSPASEPGRKPDENPVSVTLRAGFWLAKHEVTQQEWQRVMGTSLEKQFALRSASFDKVAGAGPNHPICFVNWQEAADFCRKLTEQERQAGQLEPGWKYALPTEAQWEYACRAGTTTAFGAFAAGDQANVGLKATEPVGLRRPNAWNLHDMQGNVMEWVEDRYQSQLPGGVDPLFLGQSNYRSARGGGWQLTAVTARVAHRTKMLPTFRNSLVGFRVAKVQAAE